MNKNYKRDMLLQKEWFNKLNCEYGLLKLKFPKNDITNNNYEYLDGDIILQTWSQVDSTECRLFIKKKDKKLIKFYDINLYNCQMKFYNNVMRLKSFKDMLLTDIFKGWLDNKELKNKSYIINKCKKLTLYDIWKYFLPNNKMGIDAVIETQILYEYLSFRKPFVSLYDLILIISDITQTLLNRSDLTNILSYYENNMDTLKVIENFNKIISKRNYYHKKFDKRLDYNSSMYDNNFCEVR